MHLLPGVLAASLLFGVSSAVAEGNAPSGSMVCGSCTSFAPTQEVGTPPTATVKFAKSSAAPGDVVAGTVTLTFGSGLHGYQNPPSDKYQIPVDLKVVEDGFRLLKVSYPKGKDFTVAGESKPTKVYEGTITIPFKLRAATKPATYNVNVRIEYQECNASACFPPSTVVAKATLKVAPGAKKS